MRSHFVEVPKIVRMKPGALSRMGAYLACPNLLRIFLVQSHALVPDFVVILRKSTTNAGVELLGQCEIAEASVENRLDLPAFRADRFLGGGAPQSVLQAR